MYAVSDKSAERRQRLAWLIPLLVTVVGLVGVGGATLAVVLLHDGLVVLWLLVAAAGWGGWPARWLAGSARSKLQQVCLAMALGSGVQVTLTLLLGCTGLLTRVTAIALAGTGTLLFIIYLQRHLLTGARPDRPDVAPHPLLTRIVLLACVPSLVALLFGAALPPGVLWLDDGKGYDVLEYHLQSPREYFDAGAIHFLPHNVYASFPQQIETQYLLLMHLLNDAHAAAIPAQLLHVAYGILTVLALMAWSPRGWPRITVILLATSAPWLVYVGVLAYVELGVLFYAAVAGGLILETLRRTTGRAPWRIWLAAGLCAGLAGGCKYTALALVAFALATATLITLPGNLKRRIVFLALFSAGTLAAFSPWLSRNTLQAGNPVYPFAYELFGGHAWSAEQAAQWTAGHTLPPDQSGLAHRAALTWRELFASPRYGGVIFILAVGGLLLSRHRAAALCAIWFAIAALAWATLTRMPSRFILPAIVPLIYIVSTSLPHLQTARLKPTIARTAHWSFIILATLGAVLGSVNLLRSLNAENNFWTARNFSLDRWIGQTDLMHTLQANLITSLKGDVDRVWLVGEARAYYLPPNAHYTVVFNRDPWLQFARNVPPAAATDWLRTQGATHLVFSWDEIERLRSYDFPAFVTPTWVDQLPGLERIVLPPDVAAPNLAVYRVLPP
jgi:hypothetical protein